MLVKNPKILTEMLDIFKENISNLPDFRKNRFNEKS